MNRVVRGRGGGRMCAPFPPLLIFVLCKALSRRWTWWWSYRNPWCWTTPTSSPSSSSASTTPTTEPSGTESATSTTKGNILPGTRKIENNILKKNVKSTTLMVVPLSPQPPPPSSLMAIGKKGPFRRLKWHGHLKKNADSLDYIYIFFLIQSLIQSR